MATVICGVLAWPAPLPELVDAGLPPDELHAASDAAATAAAATSPIVRLRFIWSCLSGSRPSRGA
ncbi:MAG TPA: hypothetical protein VFX52_12380 [Nocardioidaceae bacterium]|nr:hypothetical protein [Nocardioidaceae bacterium]